MIKVKLIVGELDLSGIAVITDAPKAYDGFGTIELKTYRRDRVVFIQERHYEWQTGRYASGWHKVDSELTGFSSDTIVDYLLAKLRGEEHMT